MQVKAVDYFVYNVADYQKATAFYRDTLGMKLADEFGGFWAEFAAGTSTLALQAPHEGVPFEGAGGGAAALAVDDVKAAVEELRSKGVKIVDEPMETEVCFIARIADPDGNKIILHQRKDGTAG